MPKIRVHELAKELQISSKELVNFLDKLSIAEKKAASNLSDDEVSKVRNSFRNTSGVSPKNPQEAPQVKMKEETVKKAPMQNKPQEKAISLNQAAKPNLNQSAQPVSEGAAQNPRPAAEASDSRPQQPDRRPNNQGGQSSSSQNSGQRNRSQYPSSQGGNQSQRPQNQQGGQNQRPYQQNRNQQNQQRPQNNTPRPDGENRPYTPRTDGSSRPYTPRPDGENRPYTPRTDGNSRPYTPRPDGENRPYTPRTDGNSDQRPNQNRPRPAGQGYQGSQGAQGQNRPQGQGYQGQNRPQGQGYQGQNRPQGQGYQGQNRPQGQGYQGGQGQNRPQGQGYQGGQGQNRPQGQRPGYQGGQGFVKKDGDQNDNRRPAPGHKSAKPATPATTITQKPTNKRFDKAKDLTKKLTKQETMHADAPVQKQGPKMKKLSNKERRKQAIEQKELEAAKILEAKALEEKETGIKVIAIGKNISVKELAEKIDRNSSDIIKALMKIGIMATINQEIDFYTASNIASSYDVIVEEAEDIDILGQAFANEEDEHDSEENMIERPPVVVVMGHVDHGKTSLLDSIRKSSVTDTEAGGITQHIGAYTVNVKDRPITFLDTPGHEAFTAMRMRGAQITDIAILVVAADDGVMPQTIEAINHARAANVEIIVAINKIDKASANPDRVKQELTEYGILTEDWGGETICVPVSAIKRTGIDQLLEMILLTAEMRELKANPKKRAKGTVIEGQLDKGRGPVATVLVQEGTLKIGDPIVAGGAYGKIRAMMDDKGEKVKKAGPSIPVEVLGLNGVPMAGDVFYIADTDRQARQVAESVVAQGREDMIKMTQQKVSLDDLFNQIKAGNVKDLNIVIKADVAGSVEAVKNSLERLSNEEVRIRTIHGGVGAITESDVMLASASNAIIIGFNVRPENSAKTVADQEKVDIRLYRIIYNAIEDISAAMKGMLDPVFQEKVIGHAEIRQLFKASGVGTIAGSYVTDGKIFRNSKVRVIRDNVVVYEGELAALRRFKDDVKEVNFGYECGLTFNRFNDIKEGDKVEAFIMEEVAR